MKRAGNRVAGFLFAAVLVFIVLPMVSLAEDANSDGYNDHDVGSIQAFLDQESQEAGITNCEILGYDRNDASTWTGVGWTSDSEKSVSSIAWNQSSLSGELDLSDCESLCSLDCAGTGISELSVAGCASLDSLDCGQCWISDISLSGCTALKTLRCAGNWLGELDLAGLTQLQELDCSDNGITAIDTSASTGLTALHCDLNPLTHVKAAISGGTIELASIGAGYVYLDSEGGVTVAEAESITPADFIDWLQGATIYSTENALNLTAGESITLTAEFEYIVQFDAMGGSEVADAAAPAGATILEPETSFEGYTLDGWFTEDTFENEWVFDTDTVTGDMVLYAKWDAVDYHVAYNANEAGSGTAPADAAVYHIGDPVTVLSNTGGLARTNYTFTGWNTAADGTGTHYAAADEFSMPADDVTLYAEWKYNYRVTYNKNSGTGSVPTDSAIYHTGDTVTVLGNTGGLTRTGYTLNGWNTLSNGTGTHYAPSDTFVMQTANVTLYAEWKTNYYVTYNKNSGTGTVPTDSTIYYTGDTVTVKENTGELTRTGFTFNGWNTSSSGTGTHYAPGSTFTMPSGNVTLYAEWAMNYNSHDAAAIQTFLNKNSNVSGSTNAQQLGYDANSPGTWSGVTWVLLGNERYVQKIVWNDKSLAGTLDLSYFTSLSEVQCYSNYLTALSVTGCTSLKKLDCYDNYIPSLNLNGLSAMQYLNCAFNELTSLSLGNLNALSELYCDYNTLGSLDLSGHSLLEGLSCSNCSLTSLNLNGCGELTVLDCSQNSLTSLSLTPTLYYIDCRDNPMTSISVFLPGYEQAVAISHSASGPGYVGIYYAYGSGAPKAYATPIAPATFVKWTLSDGSTSDSAELTFTKGGAYTASFVYTQGAYLSNASITAGTLSRAFSRTVYSYKVTLGEYESGLTIIPEKLFQGLGMTINGNAVSSYTVSPANGKSVTVKVKVWYGRSSHTYTFTVTRAKSTNNNLAFLSATAGSFDRTFDPNVTSYTLTLDENTKTTKITDVVAAAGLAKATPSSVNVSLSNGQTKVIKITVKAQSGAKKTYVITVYRQPSTNTALKTLKTNSKSYPLTPVLTPGVTNYTVTLPAATGSVTITTGAVGYKAVVYIDGVKKSSKKVTVASGTSVTVHVQVVAQAGNTMDYYITVTRP